MGKRDFMRFECQISFSGIFHIVTAQGINKHGIDIVCTEWFVVSYSRWELWPNSRKFGQIKEDSQLPSMFGTHFAQCFTKVWKKVSLLKWTWSTGLVKIVVCKHQAITWTLADLSSIWHLLNELLLTYHQSDIHEYILLKCQTQDKIH